MNTIFMLGKNLSVPMATGWLIADLAEFRGKQELYTRQSPQKLKVLREHALIESAISSNRIEGVEVEPGREKILILGTPAFKDRNEEEVAGYRSALSWIHSDHAGIPISESTILRFHKLSRGNIWDAGQYKEKPVDIIELSPDGSRTIRFKSVSPEETPAAIRDLVSGFEEALKDARIQPLLLLAALNLDFLCVHPFRDGNGRVSRLLLLLTCYHLGFEVGRYISLERIVEQNKERYYETLLLSSRGWHKGEHDPWPYINYLLFIIKEAYKELETRVGEMAAPRGAKMELVLDALNKFHGSFTLSELATACPGVGRDWIQAILAKLKKDGRVACEGKGRGSRWIRRKE